MYPNMNTRTVLLITLVAGINRCESKTKNTYWSKRDFEETSKTSDLLKLETSDTETFPMDKKDKPKHRLANSWYSLVPQFSSSVKDAPGTFWSKRGIDEKNKTSAVLKPKTLDYKTFQNDQKDAPATFWRKRCIEVKNKTSQLLKLLYSNTFQIVNKANYEHFPVPLFSSLSKDAHGKKR